MDHRTHLRTDVYAPIFFISITLHIFSPSVLYADFFIYAHADSLFTPKQTLSLLRLLLIHTGLYRAPWQYCRFNGSLHTFAYRPSSRNAFGLHHRSGSKSLFTVSQRFQLHSHWLCSDMLSYAHIGTLATPKQTLSPLYLSLIHTGFYWDLWQHCRFTGSLHWSAERLFCSHTFRPPEESDFKSLFTASCH